MYPSAGSQASIYTGLGFADVPFGPHSFPSQSIPELQGGDPNSPVAFKQNVNLVQQHLARVQGLARSALSGIESAYRPGTSPAQTVADLAALKQALQLLVELLGQSGVGALPILDHSDFLASLPTEEKLMEDTTKSIEVQYAQQKRIQESAAVVFNLLGSAEQVIKK